MPQPNFRIYLEKNAICVDIDQPFSKEENAKLLRRISHNKMPFPKLRLKLYNNVELDEGMATLIAATKIKSLELRLFPRGYHEKTFQTLARIIATNQLTNLELRDLRFGDKGLADLTEALSSSSSLQSLSLQDNGFSNEGARSLSVILAKNRSLLSLNLSLNNIGETGFGYIAQALSGDSKLQSLDMGFNDIRTVYYLEDMLKRNQSLKDLHLSRNKISFMNMAPIIKGLSENLSLDKLTLNEQLFSPNHIDDFDERVGIEFLEIIKARKIAGHPINISLIREEKDLLAQYQADSGSSLPATSVEHTATLMENLQEPKTICGNPVSESLQSHTTVTEI